MFDCTCQKYAVTLLHCCVGHSTVVLGAALLCWAQHCCIGCDAVDDDLHVKFALNFRELG